MKTISPGNELRFECKQGTKVRLMGGDAEVFGTCMMPGAWYTLDEGSYAIASLVSGARIETVGIENEYEAERTGDLVKIHDVLGRRGGVVVVVIGSENSGKTTTCRTLCAYAVRSGTVPTYVNLDPGNEIPGSIGYRIVRRTTVEEGIVDDEGVTTYDYGRLDPIEDFERYRGLVEKIAETVPRKTTTFVDVGSEDERVIALAMERFDPDIVLVLGRCDRLLSKLKPRFTNVGFRRLKPCEGIPARPRNRQKLKLQRYFYGTANRPRIPVSIRLPEFRGKKHALYAAYDDDIELVGYVHATDEDGTTLMPNDSFAESASFRETNVLWVDD